MAIKKLPTRLKNKTWINQPIKNHKNNHEHRLIRPQTQHEHQEHTYLKWLLKNYLQDSKTKPGPINQLKTIKTTMNTD